MEILSNKLKYCEMKEFELIDFIEKALGKIGKIF